MWLVYIPDYSSSLVPDFKLKGGRTYIFCTSDPPVRPTPFELVFMKLFCIHQMCFAESKHHNIFYLCYPFKIQQTCQLTSASTMIFRGLFQLQENRKEKYKGGSHIGPPSLIFCAIILKHTKVLLCKFVPFFFEVLHKF